MTTDIAGACGSRRDAGEPFLLDLPRADVLEDGDGVALSDGSWILVKSGAGEPARDHRRAPPRGWRGSLGISATVTSRRRSRATASSFATIMSLRDMLEGFGARLKRLEAPFTPERGAYDAAGSGSS